MYEAYTFLAWLFCLLCMDAVYQCPPMKAWSCFHGVLHLYRFCERKDYPAAVKQFHAEISGAHVVQRTLLNIRTFAHQRSCNSSFFLPGPEDANMGTRAWDLWPQSASPKLQNSQPYFLFDSFSFFFLQTSTAQMFFFFLLSSCLQEPNRNDEKHHRVTDLNFRAGISVKIISGTLKFGRFSSQVKLQ